MIDYTRLFYRVEPMIPQDIDPIMEIEHEAFSAPWSARAYDYELHYNEMAHYFVVRRQNSERVPEPLPVAAPSHWWGRWFGREKKATAGFASARPPIIGYGGYWLMVDEAHVSTIAAHRDWRRRGIGELLLVAMIDSAAEVGARSVTLEVRVSNLAAQALYRKYGFQVAGKRTNYYSDNGEDALIMSTPAITTAEFQRGVQEMKTSLFDRLSH
ncbi:MAG: ribosomal protein S18-alanine N-acetyltransferase [Chloroflexota bacterium]|nr:ribosomal protein S18-alanine N-acetyltransferase [Chloroflexota bacterium]